MFELALFRLHWPSVGQLKNQCVRSNSLLTRRSEFSWSPTLEEKSVLFRIVFINLKSKIAQRKRNGDWGYSSMGTQDDAIEEQNERLIEQLSQKVSRMKSLAVDIEQETKGQVGFLNGMHDDFDSSQNLLTNSMTRVKKLLISGRSNRATMCYVSFFVFAFFLFIYYASRLFSS